MSKVQERGLLEALGDAEGLDRVLRAMSGGRLGLQPVTISRPSGRFEVAHSWEAAKTEARSVAGTLGQTARLPVAAQREQNREDSDPRRGGDREDGSVIMVGDVRLRTRCGHSFVTCHTERCFRRPPMDLPPQQSETFCSVCGPLDEPGVHNQRDCPRWIEAHGIADRHDDGDRCNRCGDHHPTIEAARLNSQLRSDGALTARPGQGGE